MFQKIQKKNEVIGGQEIQKNIEGTWGGWFIYGEKNEIGTIFEEMTHG